VTVYTLNVINSRAIRRSGGCDQPAEGCGAAGPLSAT
jgi:hypothetical protein